MGNNFKEFGTSFYEQSFAELCRAVARAAQTLLVEAYAKLLEVASHSCRSRALAAAAVLWLRHAGARTGGHMSFRGNQLQRMLELIWLGGLQAAVVSGGSKRRWW